MFSKKDKPTPRQQAAQERYQQLVEEVSPPSQMGKGLLRAFWVGGAICCLGQALIDLGKGWLELSNMAAGAFGSSMLVFLTAILTAVGVFDRIAQYAGAGAFVPISGFANSMAAAAMEFRREGMVLGLGCKLFTIAGPVLVWGVSASVVTGLLYAVFRW